MGGLGTGAQMLKFVESWADDSFKAVSLWRLKNPL